MSQNKNLTFSQTIRAWFSLQRAAGPSQQSISPDLNIKALKSRGNDLLAQGKIGEANVYYRQVVELTPNDGVAHINLGYGLLELGELPAAKECFVTAQQWGARGAIALAGPYPP